MKSILYLALAASLCPAPAFAFDVLSQHVGAGITPLQGARFHCAQPHPDTKEWQDLCADVAARAMAHDQEERASTPPLPSTDITGLRAMVRKHDQLHGAK